jgi:hypothetical protein
LQNDEDKLNGSDEHKLLELYKELGIDYRHFDRQMYIINIQMLPALVIGLLVLYGGIKKFVGIEFDHPDAVYPIVWIGCFLISVMWIIGVSRCTQVFHIHAKTRQQCESLLGLNAHRKIAQTDKQSIIPTWLRLPHYKLRLFGFGVYFYLLLCRCPIVDFTDWGIPNHRLFALNIIISGIVTTLIWLCRFYRTSDKKNIYCGSPLSKLNKLG